MSVALNDSIRGISLFSRRTFVGGSLAATVAAVGPTSIAVPAPKQSTFVDLFRTPDSVTAFAGLNQAIPLERSGRRFASRNVAVEFAEQESGLDAYLVAPDVALTHLHARWRTKVDVGLLCF